MILAIAAPPLAPSRPQVALLLRLGAAGLSGCLGWGHGVMDGFPFEFACKFKWGPALPLALALAPLWASAPTRSAAFLTVLVWHLAAARSLPFGAAAWFEASPLYGLTLWLIASALQAGVWGLCWSLRPGRRAAGAAAAVILLALPPLGVVGWASLLAPAGALFPGMGFVGLALTLALIAALAALPLRLALLLLTAACLQGMIMSALIAPPSPPPGWRAVDTEFGETAAQDPAAGLLERQSLLMEEALKGEAQIVVYPEFSGGAWSPALEHLWRRNLPEGRAALLGVERARPDGQRDNLLMLVDRSGARALVRQRAPVPLAMWRPFTREGFAADWGGMGVAQIEGRKAAFLICYEQLLVWPVLRSALENPDALVAVSSLWWAKDTSLPRIMADRSESWARLFGWSLIRADAF